MIVSTKMLFEHAYGKYAVGAYNINNAEQIMGLFRGCIESGAPFIIQISKGARSYTDKRLLEAMIRSADEIFPKAIFAVHLDHGDEESCMDCTSLALQMVNTTAERRKLDLRLVNASFAGSPMRRSVACAPELIYHYNVPGEAPLWTEAKRKSATALAGTQVAVSIDPDTVQTIVIPIRRESR